MGIRKSHTIIALLAIILLAEFSSRVNCFKKKPQQEEEEEEAEEDAKDNSNWKIQKLRFFIEFYKRKLKMEMKPHHAVRPPPPIYTIQMIPKPFTKTNANPPSYDGYLNTPPRPPPEEFQPSPCMLPQCQAQNQNQNQNQNSNPLQQQQQSFGPEYEKFRQIYNTPYDPRVPYLPSQMLYVRKKKNKKY